MSATEDTKVKINIKKRKSICGKYIAETTSSFWEKETIITNIETGNIYKRLNSNNEIDGEFYSTAHMIGGFSGHAKVNDKFNQKYFTIELLDCEENCKIIPYSGNTVIKQHEAIFKN